MPKLREYIQDLRQDIVLNKSKHIDPVPSPGAESSRGQPVKLKHDATPEEPTRAVADEHFPAAAKKLHDAFSKRVREHGPRQFRWPDGSLKEEKPPPNPYAASNRRKWGPLVRHCREHGGDRVFENTGQSYRYGLNVSAEKHTEYLRQAGLEPEIDDTGEVRGYNSNAIDPLRDPEHALNSFYKEKAAAVFDGKRGRLL